MANPTNIVKVRIVAIHVMATNDIGFNRPHALNAIANNVVIANSWSIESFIRNRTSVRQKTSDQKVSINK